MRRILSFLLLFFSFSALAAFENCIDLFPNRQLPTSTTIGRDLCFDEFAVLYSPEFKKPIYTVEKLNKAQLSKPHINRTDLFYEETRLPKSERSTLEDYNRSGFDRGHNVPAGDMTNERSMAQSFSLANIMPQARENNRGAWARSVESPTRKYILRNEGNIYVFTGSVGEIDQIGPNHITVPEYLFKVIYDEHKHKAWGYWLKNTNDAQVQGIISYPEMVKLTGINFNLPLNDPKK